MAVVVKGSMTDVSENYEWMMDTRRQNEMKKPGYPHSVYSINKCNLMRGGYFFVV